MTENNRFGVMACLVLALAMGLAASAAAQDEPESFREQFTAFAVAMGVSHPPVLPPGTTATIDINITRWTTDEQEAQLLEVLAKKGQRKLVRELQRQPETGWIRIVAAGRGMNRTQGLRSERLRYARQIPLENGGRRVILGLDRPISMDEALTQPRWRRHDVTLFFIDFEPTGEGSGQLAIGVQLQVDQETNTLKIESFATEPVRLTRVTSR